MSNPFIAAAAPIIGSIAGSYLTGKSNEKAAAQNSAIQRELAQNGLSWRVADAKRAGINPLAALGASIPTGNPVAVGTDYGDFGMGAFGQNISRAMQSKMTAEQREIHNLNKEMLEVQIEGQKIENRNKMVGTGPPLPSAEYTSPGRNTDPTVNVVPTQINASDQQGVESGTKPMYQKVIDNEGRLTFMPTSDLADVFESYTPAYIGEMYKYIRNLFRSGMALYSDSGRRKMESWLRKIRPKAPKGYEYQYDPNNMNWKLERLPSDKRSYLFIKGYRMKPKNNEKRFKFER